MTDSEPAGAARGAGAATALAIIVCAGAVTALILVLVMPLDHDRGVIVVADVLGLGLPVAFGLYRLRTNRNDRFAAMLIGAGLLWSVTTLSQSSESVAYSTGRVAIWLFELVLVYLMLAFPYGRLMTRAERVLVGAAGVAVVLLYVPTVLLDTYPTPSPWATCGHDCPANAFQLGDSSPTFVTDVVRPLREIVTTLLFAAVAILLVRRARAAGQLMRRAVVPVAALAVFRAIALAVYFIVRKSDPSGDGAEVLGWIYVFSLPTLTLCFAAGALGQRLFVGKALEDLSAGLPAHANASQLRAAMARALEDPTLRIAYRVPGSPGGWVDETGWPVKPPDSNNGRAVTEVASNGTRLAAIEHDMELSRDPALVRAATSYALTALENERLVGELQASMRELSESRARLVAVADAERRRIERDLHDGAQQRLVALRVKLDLVAERIEAESPEGAKTLRALEDEVDATIDEVRSFARGIYPPLLAERGLSEALRAAGRGAPMPTIIDAAGLGRYSPEIEAAVYFACMEALQNAGKHSRYASGVAISVVHDGQLLFEVSDDGAGFDADDASYGAGLTNLRDRLAAVGGSVEIESAPGQGTKVRGAIPFR